MFFFLVFFVIPDCIDFLLLIKICFLKSSGWILLSWGLRNRVESWDAVVFIWLYTGWCVERCLLSNTEYSRWFEAWAWGERSWVIEFISVWATNWLIDFILIKMLINKMSQCWMPIDCSLPLRFAILESFSFTSYSNFFTFSSKISIVSFNCPIVWSFSINISGSTIWLCIEAYWLFPM